jgi:hypothetical protein
MFSLLDIPGILRVRLAFFFIISESLFLAYYKKKGKEKNASLVVFYMLLSEPY